MVGSFRRALLMGVGEENFTPAVGDNVVYFDVTVSKEQTRVYLIDESLIDLGNNPEPNSIGLMAIQEDDGTWRLLYDEVKRNNGFYTFPTPAGDEETYHMLLYPNPENNTLPPLGSPFVDPHAEWDPYNPYGGPAKSGISMIDLRQSKLFNVAGYDASDGYASDGAFESNVFLKTAYLGSGVNIGGNAFAGCTSLSSLGDSELGNVGNRAFANCTSLTSVTISGSATKVNSYAFYDCINLGSITLKPGSSTLSLGDAVFNWNGNPEVLGDAKKKTLYWDRQSLSFSSHIDVVFNPLSTVIVGESILEVPASMFSGSGMTSLTIGSRVKKINNMAFKGTKISTVKIPSSCTYIGKRAFNSCSYLESITAHDGITFIGDQAFTATMWWWGYSNGFRTLNNWLLGFAGTMSGSDFINLPSNISRIAEYAFKGQTRLGEEGVSADNTIIEYIGESAFDGCSRFDPWLLIRRLRMTSIPKRAFAGTNLYTFDGVYSGITTIEESAFENCSRVYSFVLPESLISIGSKAFSGCTNVHLIEAFCDQVPVVAIDAFGDNDTNWTGSKSSQASNNLLNNFDCYSNHTKQEFIDNYWINLFDESKCRFQFNQKLQTTTPAPK